MASENEIKRIESKYSGQFSKLNLNDKGIDEWFNYIFGPDGAKKATIEEVEAFLLNIFKK